MRCCGSCRSGGHLNLRHPIPARFFCRAVCNEYREWLRVQRGLAVASVDALMWEARHFLSWYIGAHQCHQLHGARHQGH